MGQDAFDHLLRAINKLIDNNAIGIPDESPSYSHNSPSYRLKSSLIKPLSLG